MIPKEIVNQMSTTASMTENPKITDFRYFYDVLLRNSNTCGGIYLWKRIGRRVVFNDSLSGQSEKKNDGAVRHLDG